MVRDFQRMVYMRKTSFVFCILMFGMAWAPGCGGGATEGDQGAKSEAKTKDKASEAALGGAESDPVKLFIDSVDAYNGQDLADFFYRNLDVSVTSQVYSWN